MEGWIKIGIMLLWAIQILIIGNLLGQILTPKLSAKVSSVVFVLSNIPFIVIKMMVSEEVITAIGLMALGWQILFIILAFREKFIKKSLVALLIFIMTNVSEVICLLLASRLLGDLSQLNKLDWGNPKLLLLIMLNTLTIFLIGAIWTVSWKYGVAKKEPFKMVLFVIFPLSQVMIIYPLNLGSFSYKISSWIILGIIVGLIADSCLVFIIGNQARKEELEKNLMEIQYLHQLEEEHYRSVESRREHFAKLRHDIGNQLTVIYHLLDQGDAQSTQEMLTSLQNDFKNTVEKAFCEDIIINVVMEEKAEVCKIHQIRLEAEIALGEIRGIEKVHLCSVFTNLMDNAIKASLVLEKDLRWIRIKAVYKGEYVTIKVVNNALPPQAREKPQDGHGYGLRILEEIAQKYNGSHQSKYQEGVYTGVITLLEKGVL